MPELRQAKSLNFYRSIDLETQDKIEQAKNYQSLYFLFRNIFVICLLGTFISLLIFFWVLIWRHGTHATCDSILLTAGFVTFGIITIPIANFSREKMVNRVFGSFYIECIYQLNKEKISE
jgi:hypothetical protein